ncbi:MAG TPA: tetratricopeptide repeat protein [Pyrinomonadaceae bacterium]|jgi:tetratricopeptide (TPR) repeat protein|nr:tetratricopeptide repeat protein [Pyrinomonadaceae bacterium]
MNKDNILIGIIGLLLGFIIGFMFANSANQRASQPPPATLAPQNPALPPDHPPIQSGAGAQGAMQADIQASLKLARDQPDNFDAQMKAAESYYQIQRFDEALEFLKRANQIRPQAFEPLVNLGNVYFDSGRFEEAEKWYTEALKINPDDVNVRTDLGLTFFFRTPPDAERAIKEYRASLERDPRHEPTLQNMVAALTRVGNAKEAEEMIARLGEANPSNQALSKLRSDLDKLKSQTK